MQKGRAASGTMSGSTGGLSKSNTTTLVTPLSTKAQSVFSILKRVLDILECIHFLAWSRHVNLGVDFGQLWCSSGECPLRCFDACFYSCT